MINIVQFINNVEVISDTFLLDMTATGVSIISSFTTVLSKLK